MSMYVHLKFLGLCLAILSMLLQGCLDDVPHSNPLDPENAPTNFTLFGQVGTFYQPRKPIVGATIQIDSLNVIVFSNAEGRYTIPNLPPGRHWVSCKAEGYAEMDLQIEIISDHQQDFLLDGLPQFEDILVSTHHRSRWFPNEEIYYLDFYTRVFDPDGIGDIQSVFYRIDAFDLSDTLEAGITAGVFTKTVFSRTLAIQSIHQLIGKKIDFFVQDDFGMQTQSEPIFLTRIIDQVPVILSPSELQSVPSDSIVFRWERVFLPYEATLSIEIFQINLGIALKQHSITNIPINKSEYSSDQSVSRGDYYWNLLIVDEFGNSSGSKEGVFRVE